MTHRNHKQFNTASFIKIQAPRLDAYIGLLEPPSFVLFLGDSRLAERKIKKYFPEATIIMTQRQFNREGLNNNYQNKVATIDIEQDYQLTNYRRPPTDG